MIAKLLVFGLLLAAIYYFFFRDRGGPDDRGPRLPRPEPETPQDEVDGDDGRSPELEPVDGEDRGGHS